jgi:F-type H+-transporting ATPase subunit alpha
MKKVAGTLKLDQAQFRELEAFAKFGSDLDAATKLTIERGRKNQEILKQAQYSPVRVGHQVAIIYVATNGLIDSLPVEKTKAFQVEFLRTLEASHQNVLDALGAGKFDDTLTATLATVAKDIVKGMTAGSNISLKK